MQGVNWRRTFGLDKQTENLNFSLNVRQKYGKWASHVPRVCPRLGICDFASRTSQLRSCLSWHPMSSAGGVPG